MLYCYIYIMAIKREREKEKYIKRKRDREKSGAIWRFFVGEKNISKKSNLGLDFGDDVCYNITVVERDRKKITERIDVVADRRKKKNRLQRLIRALIQMLINVSVTVLGGLLVELIADLFR